VLRRAGNDITAYDGVVPPSHRRAPRLIAAGVAVAAVIAGFVAFTLLHPVAGGPAAPPPSVAPGTSGVKPNCLASLADAVAPAPYDGRTGRYEYVKWQGFSGDTAQVPDKGTFARATWEEAVTRWLGDDGSGRMTVDRGPAQYPDNASKQYFQSHPDALRPRHDTQTMAPGELSVQAIPAADPAAMAEALYQPRENGPSQALVGVADLSGGRLLDAAHRVAVLRFLASTEGVICGGHVLTAVGAGMLVSAPIGKGPMPSPGNSGYEVLLFDELTGELKASGMGEQPVEPISWSRVVLERGYTDALG
jgi:hypothetical protein